MVAESVILCITENDIANPSKRVDGVFELADCPVHVNTSCQLQTPGEAPQRLQITASHELHCRSL